MQQIGGLLKLEKWKIKYGCGHLDTRNNFLHWSFSKFGMEFELKIREPI
jgi:hypothetical protein